MQVFLYFEGEQFDVEQIDNPINMYISGEKEDLEINYLVFYQNNQSHNI